MIEIRTDGTKLFRRIDLGVAALNDLTPAFEEVDKVFRQMERAHFDTQGARSGQTWTDLSDSYKAAKERKYGGKPILRRTDRLYNSLVNEGGEHIKNITKLRAEYGTRVPYGIVHQYGISGALGPARLQPRGGRGQFVKQRRMPARPPIPNATSEDMAMISDIFLEHVLKPMKQG